MNEDIRAVLFDLDNTLYNRDRTFERWARGIVETHFANAEEADIVGAKRVGMAAAWLHGGADWPAAFAETPPDFIIGSLHEIASLVLPPPKR